MGSSVMGSKDRRSNRSRVRRRIAPLLSLALLAAVLVGCEAQPPEERVAELRSEYQAELNSFSVRETPMLEESGMAGDEAMAGEGEAEGEVADADAAPTEEGADEGIVEEVPVRQDVLLDVVIRKDGSTDTLPGLTLDVYQQGTDGQEKANYRIYVETDRLNKGSRKAVSHVLEDVDYEEGDGFAVEVRQPVPPELYGEYQEFQVATGEEAGG